MKTNLHTLRASLMALALIGPTSFAQDENYSSDDTSYEAPDATTVVYDAPATYYASVIYQAPVIYNAPVFYLAAASAAVSCAAQAQYQQPQPVSTVYVIGGGGTYSYSNYGSSCGASTVVQFGQRGGWFGPR